MAKVYSRPAAHCNADHWTVEWSYDRQLRLWTVILNNEDGFQVGECAYAVRKGDDLESAIVWVQTINQ